MQIRSLKFKIILSTLACIILVGVTSNAAIFRYLYQVIENRADRINELYLDTIYTQFKSQQDEIVAFGIQCANDSRIRKASAYKNLSTLSARRDVIDAQSRLSSYQAAFKLSPYVNYLTVFNEDGVYFHSEKMQERGRFTDGQWLGEQIHTLYADYLSHPKDAPVHLTLASSLADRTTPVFVGIFPVWGTHGVQKGCFIYLELDFRLFTDVLDPYAEFNDLFLSDGTLFIHSSDTSLPFAELIGDGNHKNVAAGDSRYQVASRRLPHAGLSVYSSRDMQGNAKAILQMVYPALIVAVSSLLAGTLLALLLTNYISRPLNRLTDKLRRISMDRDFSYDPALEQSRDEIGEVGRVVNEMAASIDGLLSNTKEMYEQQKNAELALLQSQVNPHFLYNTLDSIQWMATIQDAPGAAAMTHSLSNLLRNIAKGTSDSIPLREELSILEDYLAIQSIRYLESFEVINHIRTELLSCRIVKFTLQPIVENAIFHGIEPSGHFGSITIDADRDREDLVLTIEDNGVGMTEEELEKVRSGNQSPFRSSLSKIGISNVHTRLQLAYGAGYGLTIESEKDSYTRVSVRIPWNPEKGADAYV